MFSLVITDVGDSDSRDLAWCVNSKACLPMYRNFGNFRR